MALTTTSQVLLALQQYEPDADEVTRYDLLRTMVEAAVKSYCKWNIEQDTITEYYDGTGRVGLVLRQPFVSSVSSVYLDPYGYAGQGENAYASATLLTAGEDYMLQREGPDVSKCAVLQRLSIASYAFFPSTYPWLQGSGGLAYNRGPFWQPGQGNIKVTYTYGFPGAVALATPFVSWSGGVATFTTVAAHGLTTGMRVNIYGTGTAYDGTNFRVATAPTATTFTMPFVAQPSGTVTEGTASGVPYDLAAAVCASVGLFRNTILHGYAMTSEGLGDYNYSISLQREPNFMDIRQLLSQYRDMPLGGF